MSSRVITSALAALILAIGLGGSGQPAIGDEAALAPFETLRLTARLARWGQENGDPLALVAAARMRQGVPVTLVTRTEAAPGPGPAERWLDEAEALAGGDPAILSLVQATREAGTKGRSGGPRVSLARIPGGGTNRYLEPFEADRPAVVYVEGDGDTDLDLRIRSGDRVACADATPGDIKMCVWTPEARARYVVEVTNGGVIDNDYALATN